MYARILSMKLFWGVPMGGWALCFCSSFVFTLLDVYSSFYSDVYAYDIGPGRRELRGVLLAGGGEI
jgi:hypothetical protein